MNQPNPPNCEYKKVLTPTLMPCSFEGHCEHKKLFAGMNRNRSYCWYEHHLKAAELTYERERLGLIRKMEEGIDGNNR